MKEDKGFFLGKVERFLGFFWLCWTMQRRPRPMVIQEQHKCSTKAKTVKRVAVVLTLDQPVVPNEIGSSAHLNRTGQRSGSPHLENIPFSVLKFQNKRGAAIFVHPMVEGLEKSVTPEVNIAVLSDLFTGKLFQRRPFFPVGRRRGRPLFAVWRRRVNNIESLSTIHLGIHWEFTCSIFTNTMQMKPAAS